MTPADGGAAEPVSCPFCGADNASYGYSWPGYAEGKHGIVQCHSCDAIMLGDDQDHAVAQWNRRHQP